MEFLNNRGVVTRISSLEHDTEQGGCLQLVSIEDNKKNRVDFVLSEDTYLINHQPVQIGDFVTGYYDALAPTPLIYPPRYQAIVLVKEVPYQNVKVDFFNEQLISSDGRLKLNLSPYTRIQMTNGQTFGQFPSMRNLVVVYGTSTKSIPAQTTPYQVIVLCPS